MVTVQFSFKTILEAQEFLARQTQQVSGPVAVAPLAIVLPQGPQPETVTTVAYAEPATVKKRGPKPKAEPTKEYGMEDSRFAFSGLFDIKGRDAAKAVLAEFKVARVSELNPDQHRDFIVRCGLASQPE